MGRKSRREEIYVCGRCGFDLWVRKSLWSRKRQLNPVFLPGEPRGQRRFADYSPWSHKESDTTEGLSMHMWFWHQRTKADTRDSEETDTGGNNLGCS